MPLHPASETTGLTPDFPGGRPFGSLTQRLVPTRWSLLVLAGNRHTAATIQDFFIAVTAGATAVDGAQLMAVQYSLVRLAARRGVQAIRGDKLNRRRRADLSVNLQ